MPKGSVIKGNALVLPSGMLVHVIRAKTDKQYAAIADKTTTTRASVMAAIRNLPANAVVTAMLPGRKKPMTVGSPTQARAAIPKYPAGSLYVSVPAPLGSHPSADGHIYAHSVSWVERTSHGSGCALPLQCRRKGNTRDLDNH